jgi:uncharacterized membrane protein YfcA
MDPKTLLLAALVAIVVFYAAFWFVTVRRRRAETQDRSTLTPQPITVAISFIANFLDTLGIGSYATTTSMFRMGRVVRDELIPGSLNVGYVLPTLIQALIFITVVEVDFTTLVVLIAGACLGAWLGAGVVAGMSRRGIQLGMGSALLFLSLIVLAQLLEIVPSGTALALSTPLLAIGFAVNFVLGALMTLGVGLYAPCMVMVSLLGMNPTAAFPIMMGSCAFLMPVASVQFIKKNRYDLRAALAMALGGAPAVLIAVALVLSLPTQIVRVLVLFVILYTAFTMLRAAAQEREGSRPAAPAL